MLKNIPPELTPELVKFMMEMGCEDELLIAGANYSVMSRGIQRVCYVSGSVNDILNAILALYPLNESAMPATMCFEEGDEPQLYRDFRNIISRFDSRQSANLIDRLDKYPFINLAEKVYCAVITSDKRKNCEIILTKGAV